MKPSISLLKFSKLARMLSVISLTVSASAAPITWTGPTNGSWADGVNWVGGVVPGTGDVANFITSTATTINLNGSRQVQGLETPNSTNDTNVHTLLAGGTNTTLTIGADGIKHFRGGLFIGSTTDGQKVDILLAASQTWNSSRDNGSGDAQPITARNNVTLGPSLGAQNLTLTGSNNLSAINGVLGNASGSTLSIIKDGGGIWTLNGANTYSGTTQVNAGTLRLGEAGSITPSSITVAGGATLTLKLESTAGGAGFNEAEVATMAAGLNLGATASFGLDTSNGFASYGGSALANIRFVKTGGNTLLLTGVHAPISTSVREGTLQLSEANTLSGPITVANNSSVIARAYNSSTGGFTESQITNLRNSLTVEGTSHFGISTANGDFSYGAAMATHSSNALRFSKVDSGTLFLTGQSTYNAGNVISAGILSVSDIKNGGLASQIGASAAVPNGIILAGGRLQYTGTGASTNRLFNLTGSSAIESSGTGALVFTNTDAMSAEFGARNLILTGYNRDDNEMRVSLRDITTGNNRTNIHKTGFGKWILSGNNTYTGDTIVRGGTLVFDFSQGRDPLASTSNLVVHTGIVQFVGSGVETIGSMGFNEADNGFATTKVSGGMNLHVSTLYSNNSTQRMVLIDLLGEGNSFTYSTLGTGLRNTDSGNLLMVTNGRSNIVVRANDGSYGFAAAVGGAIGKLTGQTSIVGGTSAAPTSLSATSNTTNYLLSAGHYLTSASLNYQTITLDSSAGAIQVEMASGHNFNSTGNGRSILMTGSNDVTFSGAGGAIAMSTWMHNYLEDSAQLNIANNLGTGFLMVGGTGFTNFTGSSLAANEFVLNGGLFRIGTDQELSGIYRINDAVFEIGAKLTGGSSSDHLSQETGRFRLLGDSGFSAYGVQDSVRTVTLGSDVTWGSSNFLVTSAGGDGDHAFRLSSTRSNATLDFKSNIDLNGKMRTVDVANGSASIDARLSGNLTGSGIGSRLAKTGLGTLELTGTNTYSGMTRVEEGKLRISGGGLIATTSIHVQNSTLELAAGNVINDAADITLENATFSTASAPETLGRLTLIGDNKLDLVGLGNIIKMADSSSLVWSSSLSIYNWNGNAGGGGADQFFIGTTNGGVTTDQLSKIFFVDPTVDGISYAGTFNSSILGNGEIVAVIPEPSAAALGMLASVTLLMRRRRP